ncbi:unnamed protein product, partial [Mesorhabditis spiculigera]
METLADDLQTKLKVEEEVKKDGPEAENAEKKPDEKDEECAPEEHHDKFNPHAYLNAFYKSATEDTAMQVVLFFLPGILYRVPGKISTFLDLGAGPTVYFPIAIRHRAERIFSSDYAPANRAALIEWAENKSSFNWGEVCKWIASIEASNESQEQMEKGARDKLQAILEVDVHAKPVVKQVQWKKDPGVDVPKKFQVVSSVFCLEYSCETYDGYIEAVTSAASLVEDGGYLILGGVLDATSYTFDGKQFRSHRLHKSHIIDALRTNGFGHIEKTDDFKYIEAEDIFLLYSKRRTCPKNPSIQQVVKTFSDIHQRLQDTYFDFQVNGVVCLEGIRFLKSVEVKGLGENLLFLSTLAREVYTHLDKDIEALSHDVESEIRLRTGYWKDAEELYLRIFPEPVAGCNEYATLALQDVPENLGKPKMEELNDLSEAVHLVYLLRHQLPQGKKTTKRSVSLAPTQLPPELPPPVVIHIEPPPIEPEPIQIEEEAKPPVMDADIYDDPHEGAHVSMDYEGQHHTYLDVEMMEQEEENEEDDLALEWITEISATIISEALSQVRMRLYYEDVDEQVDDEPQGSHVPTTVLMRDLSLHHMDEEHYNLAPFDPLDAFERSGKIDQQVDIPVIISKANDVVNSFRRRGLYDTPNPYRNREKRVSEGDSGGRDSKTQRKDEEEANSEGVEIDSRGCETPMNTPFEPSILHSREIASGVFEGLQVPRYECETPQNTPFANSYLQVHENHQHLYLDELDDRISHLANSDGDMEGH